MQLHIVLASNALFLLAYTFSLSWLSFGINGYTILKHKVPPDKVRDFVKNLPFYMRFWYMYLAEDKFHKDPAKTLSTTPTYISALIDCIIGGIFLFACFAFIIVIMLYSIWIRDSLTIVNCLAIIGVFFGGIGWYWYLNNKLIA